MSTLSRISWYLLYFICMTARIQSRVVSMKPVDRADRWVVRRVRSIVGAGYYEGFCAD